MMTTMIPAGSRKKVLAWAVAAFILAGLIIGWAMKDRGTTENYGSPSNPALNEIAKVFDKQLAGVRVADGSHFAEQLAAVRPEALQNEGWPKADYALLDLPNDYGSDAKAVGIVVWVGNRETGNQLETVCAEVGVNRGGARIRVREMVCPENVPPKSGRASGPQEPAVNLRIPHEVQGPLVSGQYPKQGSATAGYLPEHPAQAAARCAATDLAATIDSGNSAGNTTDFILRVQNISAQPCELAEATGIEISWEAQTLQPPWAQGELAVTLQPWESAAIAMSFKPDYPLTDPQTISLLLADGSVLVGPETRPMGIRLWVAPTTQISATPWEVVGYGVGLGTWENGFSSVDIAPPCQAQQLGVTTPQPAELSPYDNETDKPEELPYVIVNISTSTCRIDSGSFTTLHTVPPLEIDSIVVLQPGTLVRLETEGGAPDLSDSLVVDGVRISTNNRDLSWSY